jgi:Ubiquitin-conjugating enzyme
MIRSYGRSSYSVHRTRSSFVSLQPALSSTKLCRVVFYPRGRFAFHSASHCALAAVVYSSEGGIFKAKMTFPKDYPNMPPKLVFDTELWHPNSMPALFVVWFGLVWFGLVCLLLIAIASVFVALVSFDLYAVHSRLLFRALCVRASLCVCCVHVRTCVCVCVCMCYMPVENMFL